MHSFSQIMSPCHLVLSTRRVLPTVLTILLQCFLSAVTSLSSASFIPVTSCISSIHFLGRPLLLLRSPYASIILFSSPSDRIRGNPFMTSTRRGSGSGGPMWTGVGGPAPCGRPHRKLKLESTDVILSSSHAKKLASFLPESLDRKKLVICLRYKLVI